MPNSNAGWLVMMAAVAMGFGCGLSAAPVGAVAPVRIVTSFYPIYIATLNVVKDVPGVELRNLTQPFTGCLHDYQLAPDDLVMLSRANIFVTNGAGMESFLDKVVAQVPKLQLVEASAGLTLLKGQGEHAEPNAHVWLSISLAKKQVATIAAGLGRADPTRAERYTANANAYIASLEALREKMLTALDKVKTRDIITFHEAFPYFAQEFKLNIVAVIEREPGTEPSAGELAATIRIVRAKGVKVLFAEPQYPAKAAATIARETGASVHMLDPVVTGKLEADAYLKAMAKNLEVLQQALR